MVAAKRRGRPPKKTENEKKAKELHAATTRLPPKQECNSLRGDLDYDDDTDPRKAYECLANGGSPEELPIELNVLPDTARHWLEKYPEFNSMVRQGLEVAKAWWDKVGRENISNHNFNNGLYKFFMAERFGCLGNNPVGNLKDKALNTYADKSLTATAVGDGSNEHKGDGNNLSPDADEWAEAQKILSDALPEDAQEVIDVDSEEETDG